MPWGKDEKTADRVCFVRAQHTQDLDSSVVTWLEAMSDKWGVGSDPGAEEGRATCIEEVTRHA